MITKGSSARVVQSDAGNEGRVVTVQGYDSTSGMYFVRALELRAVRHDGTERYRDWGFFRPEQLELAT